MVRYLFHHITFFRFLLIITGIPLIIVVAGYSVVYAQIAQQVTITAIVPEKPPLPPADTVVILQGISYPSATLTIRQDGILLVQITTDAQARFNVSAIVQPGAHTYTIFGADSNGTIGKESNFALTLSEGTTTTISGIFLGPTITIDKTVIGSGETATLTGTTAPNSEVNVTLTSTQGVSATAGGPRTAVQIASADGNGRWLQLYDANDLVVGPYTAHAQAIEPISRSVSEFSHTVSFEVTGSGQPDQCTGKVVADINCDGAVNLVDFSILLFYWESSNPANPRADINTDGIVNIIDFSIMMFYWTG
jgi:hypothetical protein